MLKKVYNLHIVQQVFDPTLVMKSTGKIDDINQFSISIQSKDSKHTLSWLTV